MKFLCVECDEAMKLKETRGPNEGSMTILYQCEKCKKEMAMLTNAMETQVVGSLGVSIGSKPSNSQPMQGLKNSLSVENDNVSKNQTSDSNCPFTEVVSDAFAKQGAKDVAWTKEAEERLDRIPSFVRPMAKKGIEQYAAEQGYGEINNEVMDEVKDIYGM